MLKLGQYGKELVGLAQNGELMPVVGRDDELNRLMMTLKRASKNCPVIVGDSGVGKTALVELLAQRIAANNVPDALCGVGVFVLDMPRLVSGARYRGDFEERMKSLVDTLIDSGGQTILCIDDLSAFVGPSSGDRLEGLDILKPYLSNGSIRCVAICDTTTYRRRVVVDPSLSRIFQIVKLTEPDVPSCVDILTSRKRGFEGHHGIVISEAAIDSAVALSVRYLSARCLPDVAIDVLDAACAKLRMDIDVVPDDLKQLAKDAINKSVGAGCEGDKELALNAVDHYEVEMDTHVNVKSSTDEILKLKSELDTRYRELDIATSQWDQSRVALLTLQEIPALKQQISRLGDTISDEGNNVLDAKNVTEIVSDIVGIPLGKMSISEEARYGGLEKRLASRVIGQEVACEAVSNSIMRNRMIGNSGRPIGSFLLIGPTGVGKTELAKCLAESLFDHPDHLIRIDMSEYMDKQNVARLIGAAPGLVGYGEGGQLTEAVRSKPYSVVLIDELEKAHPDVTNILLQVMDDGRLTDSQGRTVDFRHCVLLMTSNVGAEAALSGREGWKGDAEKILKSKFKPEFINRIEEIVYFDVLNIEALKKIVKIFVDELRERLKGRVSLVCDEMCYELIAKRGNTLEYGARPLRRLVRECIETPLAFAMLDAETGSGSLLRVRFDVLEDELVLTVEGERKNKE